MIHVFIVSVVTLSSIIINQNAAAFDITPTRVNINANEGIGTLNLENTRDQAATFRVEALSWNESKDVQNLTSTERLFAVPQRRPDPFLISLFAQFVF